MRGEVRIVYRRAQRPRPPPAMAHRMESVDGDLAEELFVLMMMGDGRAVERVYVGGVAAV